MVFTSDLSIEEQRSVADAALGGTSMSALAATWQLSLSQVRTILHRVCLHANPDLYCDTVKAAVKRSPSRAYGHLQGYAPSLTFLRQHRHAFGWTAPKEILHARS